MSWYLEALSRYAEFDGRSRRKEYWYFILFNIIISVILVVIDVALGTYSANSGMGLLGGIYTLAVFIPGLAVTVRRLHDTGRSGWWLLIGVIPYLGALILLFFLVQDSDYGDNQYGPNPKAVFA